MRGERPFVFTNIKAGDGVGEVANFIIREGGLGMASGATSEQAVASVGSAI